MKCCTTKGVASECADSGSCSGGDGGADDGGMVRDDSNDGDDSYVQ